jgi:uncharacterized protein with GYD domain
VAEVEPDRRRVDLERPQAEPVRAAGLRAVGVLRTGAAQPRGGIALAPRRVVTASGRNIPAVRSPRRRLCARGLSRVGRAANHGDLPKQGGVAMSTYLTGFKQTADTWAKLIANPENRREALAPAFEAAGGKLMGYWYAFGDVDGYVLFEAPDDVAAASVMVKVNATGALTVSTTKLLTVEEALEAMRRSSEVAYSPPGSGG